jgi:hypothetical protein
MQILSVQSSQSFFFFQNANLIRLLLRGIVPPRAVTSPLKLSWPKTVVRTSCLLDSRPPRCVNRGNFVGADAARDRRVSKSSSPSFRPRLYSVCSNGRPPSLSPDMTEVASVLGLNVPIVARVPMSVVLAEVAPLVAMDVRSKFAFDKDGTDARSSPVLTWLFVEGRTVRVGSDGREVANVNGNNGEDAEVEV